MGSLILGQITHFIYRYTSQKISKHNTISTGMCCHIKAAPRASRQALTDIFWRLNTLQYIRLSQGKVIPVLN